MTCGATIIGILKKDMLVNNFHIMKVILTNWRVFFGLCNLLFRRHHYDVSKQFFFNIMRDQNIQRKKCDNVLQRNKILTCFVLCKDLATIHWLQTMAPNVTGYGWYHKVVPFAWSLASIKVS